MANEYETVKNNAGFIELDSAKILISGEKAVSFINNTATNDIASLKQFQGIDTAFLDRFGRVLSYGFMYNLDNSLLFILEHSALKETMSHLSKLALLVRCEVKDISDELSLVSFQGPNSKESLKNFKLPEKKFEVSKSSFKDKELFIMRSSRTSLLGFDVFIPKEIKDDFVSSLDINRFSYETFNILRIESGIPLFNVDFNRENVLLETGLDCIDHKKGCYTGQEIIARMISRKAPPVRRITSLILETDKIPLSKEVLFNNEKAGLLTSVVFSPSLSNVISLALIRKPYYDENEFLVGNVKAFKTNFPLN